MLYIWMPDADQHWRWSVGDDWQSAENLDRLKEAVAVHQPKQVTVFFSSIHVQHLQQTLQKSHYKQLGEHGVAYLIEDQVVEPIDQLRLCQHYANDQLNILAIAKSRLEMMQHSLALLPWQIEALLPDYLIVPAPKTAQEVVVQAWNAEYLVRTHEYQGFLVDDVTLLQEYFSTDHIFVVSETDSLSFTSLQDLVGTDHVQQRTLNIPADTKYKRHAFNLWKSQKSQHKVTPIWKACAAVLVAAIGVQLVHDVVHWYKLKKVADQTSVLMIDQYRQWFGQGYRVTEQSIKSDFEARVRLSQSADLTALSLLSRIGPVMAQQNVVAEKIDFKDSILTIDLKASNAKVLESMTQQLNQQGFKAQLGNIQTVGNQVLGWIKVQ